MRASLGYKLSLTVSIANTTKLFYLFNHYGIYQVFKQCSCHTVKI